MQIKRANGDLQQQIAPRDTDLLLTGRFQVRVLAREPNPSGGEAGRDPGTERAAPA
jgi:hypothetical protein